MEMNFNFYGLFKSENCVFDKYKLKIIFYNNILLLKTIDYFLFIKYRNYWLNKQQE